MKFFFSSNIKCFQANPPYCDCEVLVEFKHRNFKSPPMYWKDVTGVDRKQLNEETEETKKELIKETNVGHLPWLGIRYYRQW